MADVAISYSHRDSEAARRIESEITAGGRSVWLDAPSERSSYGSGITLPSGQNHWDVISREFLNASVIVVVATANWARSEYCRREYEFVREWGKWVVFINTPEQFVRAEPIGEPHTTVAGLLAELGQHEVLAETHARLVSSAMYGESSADGPTTLRAGIIERTLKRSEAIDANSVVTGAAEAPWHCITPRVDQRIRELLDRDRAIRRRLRTFAVTAVATLTVCALAGVAAWAIALIANHDARTSADHAQSIALANRSASETSTLTAIQMAQRAVDLHRDSVSETALAVAKDRDNRLRTVPARADRYFGMTMAPVGERAAAASADFIVIFNRTTGVAETSFPAEVGPRFGSVLFSPTADRILFINSEHTLVSRPVSGGGERGIAAKVDAGGADGDRLWWSSGEKLLSGDFDGNVHATLAIPFALTALSADSGQHLLDAVGRNSSLYTFTIRGTTPSLIRTQELGGATTLLSSTTSNNVAAMQAPSADSADNGLTNRERTLFGQYSASEDQVAAIPPTLLNGVVKRCGQHVFGGIANYKLRISGTMFDATATSVHAAKSVSGIQPPICLSDDNAWTTSIYEDQMTFRPGPQPFLPVSQQSMVTAQDQTGRIYALSSKGKLYSMLPASMATKTSASSSNIVVKVGSTALGFTEDGRIVNTASGAAIGADLGRLYLNVIAVNSDSAAILSDKGVVIVNDHSLVATVPMSASDPFYEVSGAGDGKRYQIVYGNHVDLVSADGRVERTVSFPWLSDDDVVVSATTSPDGSHMAVATARGRVASMPITTTGPASFLDPPLTSSYDSTVAYTGKGELVVISPEGQVMLLGEDMKRTRSVVFGAAPDVVQVAGDRILLSADTIGSVVYRTDDLAAIARLDDTIGVRYSVHMNSSGTEAIGTRMYQESPSANTFIAVPLPRGG